MSGFDCFFYFCVDSGVSLRRRFCFKKMYILAAL